MDNGGSKRLVVFLLDDVDLYLINTETLPFTIKAGDSFVRNRKEPVFFHMLIFHIRTEAFLRKRDTVFVDYNTGPSSEFVGF